MIDSSLPFILRYLSIMDFMFGHNIHESQLKTYLKTFIKGFAYANLAIILALLVFKPQASFIMIIFSSFFAIPFIYTRLKKEEHFILDSKSEKPVLKHHAQLFMMFLILFLGFGTAFTGWFIFSPESIQQPLFSVQSEIVNNINLITARIISVDDFSIILAHNVKVFFVALILSFIFGYGALFILTWNSALVSVAIGTKVLSSTGSSFIKILSFSTLGYMLHGIPEFMAYIVAGVIGSIISIALVNKDINVKNWKKVAKDSSFLFIISGCLLVISALIEVHVSPFFL